MKERFWELAYKAMIGLMVIASISAVFMWASILVFGEPQAKLVPDSPPGYFHKQPEPPRPTAEQQAQLDRADEIDRLNTLASEIDVYQPAPFGE